MIVAREPGLHLVHALDHQRREPQHVVAEAGIGLVAGCNKALGKQPPYARGIAQRRTGPGLEAEHFAVGAEQSDLQQPRALAAPLHRGRQFARELLDGAEHIRFQPDGIGETLLGGAGRHRQKRRDRFLLAPEGLIDPAQELRAEPRGQRRARPRHHIADRFQARLRERTDALVVHAQRAKRQRLERGVALALGHDREIAKARDGPGAADGIRHAKPCIQALPPQPPRHVA